MTNPSDRDVDRLLKSARLAPAGAPLGACLDAETLAAWVDGTLSPSESAAAERHAADCARCQTVLAAMIRTEPPAAAPAGGWSPWRLARWAVPLSAAAAVALWFAVDRDVAQRQPTESAVSAPSQSVASPPPTGPAAVMPSVSPAPGAAGRASADSSSVNNTSRRADASKPTLSAERDGRKEAPARSELRDLAAHKDAPPQPAPSEADDRRAAGPPPAAPVPTAEARREAASEATAKALPPPAAPPALPPPTETVVIAPQATQQADTQPHGPSQARLRQSVAQSAARPVWIDVATPDPLVKWRFSVNAVEQSTDGGVTWTRQPVGSPAIIVAGAAPSSSACWFVGGGGLVLRFTTARGWQRLSVPNAPDLVAVEAKDADNATVVLANGRRLTTSDGGATWR